MSKHRPVEPVGTKRWPHEVLAPMYCQCSDGSTQGRLVVICERELVERDLSAHERGYNLGRERAQAALDVALSLAELRKIALRSAYADVVHCLSHADHSALPRLKADLGIVLRDEERPKP